MKASDLMGKVVLVDRFLWRSYPPCVSSEYRKVWKEWPAEGRPGWVVGERWIQNGATSFGYGSDYPPEWNRSGPAVHCLLVCYWPTLKPLRVPFDGYRLAPSTTYPYPTRYPWNETSKEGLRKEMKDWPRDKKGRWIKKENPKGVVHESAISISSEHQEGRVDHENQSKQS